MTDHRQTAKWLLVLANTLGPRERNFLNAMLMTGKPSPAQTEWLNRIVARVEEKARKGMRHAA